MQLIGLARLFHGLASTPTWAGKSQINSGDQSVTVSAQNVTSGGQIFLTRSGSGSPMHDIAVDSIVEGTSFAVRCDSGASTGNIPFSWLVVRP